MFKYSNTLKFHSCFFVLPKLKSTLSSLPILRDTLKASEFNLTTNNEKSNKILEYYGKIKEICMNGGGEKGQALHVKKNKKILPRDRISALLDSDSNNLELSTEAGLGLEYGDIPGAGSICMIGKIHGLYCLISANDGSLKGGTFFPITVTKNLRAQRISSINYVPKIFLVDSGGGFLPLQADLFPDKSHGGRAFYNQAVDRAKGIPQMALVCGSCTAGGAYVPMMCDDTAITHKIGSIYLGGPPLVKAATGEDISAEDLGGATLHCNVSGCTDYFAPTEEEGFEVLRDVVSTFNISPVQTLDEYHPIYDVHDLDDMCGLDNIDRERTLGLISRLTDGSRFRHFKEKYGQNLIAGYAFIDRRCVGLLANCGPITYEDGLKGSHFVQICNQRELPIVFLQNSGDKNGYWSHANSLSSTETNECLRGRTTMMAALSCSDTPKITINVGGCHGDDNYTMCGPAFEPNFIFCWPGAETTLNCPVDDDTEKKRLHSKSSFQFSTSSSWYFASRVLNDGIIKPSETRKIIQYCLRIFEQKKRITCKQNLNPIFRF